MKDMLVSGMRRVSGRYALEDCVFRKSFDVLTSMGRHDFDGNITFVRATK
jgi:hypothetical protein